MNDINFQLYVLKFYKDYAPDKLSTAPRIIQKSKGKEDILLNSLEKKYDKRIDRNLPISDVYDFHSSNFDPELALLAPLKPPIEGCLPLDNLSKCCCLLPKTHPEYVDPPKPILKEVKPKLQGRNVIREMADKLQNGPFSLLYNSYIYHTKIRIVTRRINGIRGFLTGYVKGFDKHMNILLKDAYEEWTQFIPKSIDEEKKLTTSHPSVLKEEEKDNDDFYIDISLSSNKLHPVSHLPLDLENEFHINNNNNKTYQNNKEIQNKKTIENLSKENKRQCIYMPQLNSRYIKLLFVRGDMVISVYNEADDVNSNSDIKDRINDSYK
ncbi:hypothetical protein WA158_002350 [Blastocystis sp. Blastoise]